MIGVISGPDETSVTTDRKSDRTLQAVRAIPMFRGLSPDDQTRLAALATLREFSRGEYLWRALDESRQRPRYIVEAITAGSTLRTVDPV